MKNNYFIFAKLEYFLFKKKGLQVFPNFLSKHHGGLFEHAFAKSK